MSRHRCSIVACARWEAQDIGEWVMYHASVGFDHIYLYCNDDDPAELHAAVAPFLCGPTPYVTFLYFPFHGQQRGMYLHFLQTQLHESDWVIFLDIDEFLFIPRDASIDVFLARVAQDADAIYFNWLMFGNSGHAERSAGSVLENYTRHESALHPYTKVIFRTGRIDVAFVKAAPQHFWHELPDQPGRLRKFNVFGDAMDAYYDDFPEKAAAYIQQPNFLERALATAVICHYCIKSESDFDRRVNRGAVGEFSGQVVWGEQKKTGDYKATLNQLNALEFTGLRAYWQGLHRGTAVPGVVEPVPSRNLAMGKPALQSSVSRWSSHPDAADDAGGAVSGRYTGRFQFHTSEEYGAWWQVDLQQQVEIAEIRVFNRIDMAQDRARHLSLGLSDDGTIWNEVLRKTDDALFGGIDGFPLIFKALPGLVGRFLRVTLLGVGYLHLDQVEVYERLPA